MLDWADVAPLLLTLTLSNIEAAVENPDSLVPALEKAVEALGGAVLKRWLTDSSHSTAGTFR
eukprot:461174-Prymnesium_polylepis.1